MDDDKKKKRLWWRYALVGVLASSFIIHIDGYLKAELLFALFRLVWASGSAAAMVWLIMEIATIRQEKR